MIFESHGHYDDPAFDGDREKLLSQMKENGIQEIINVGYNIKSCKATIKLTKEYINVYGAIGVHPSDIACLDECGFSWLKDHVTDEKIVAVGEIGLDYYWEKDPQMKEIQRTGFKQQLLLAKEKNLPVIVHSRDAAQDTLKVMKECRGEEIRGVIHCFSYSIEMAKSFLEMGYFIGIGGVITFPNAKKLKEAVEQIPLEKILVETDCPYLAPIPNRGKRNDSTNLPYIVAEIAKIKACTYEEVAQVTRKNARTLFGFKEESIGTIDGME